MTIIAAAFQFLAQKDQCPTIVNEHIFETVDTGICFREMLGSNQSSNADYAETSRGFTQYVQNISSGIVSRSLPVTSSQHI